MRKPTLDDYDNGYRNRWERLRFPGESHETKEQRAERRRKLFLEIWRNRVDMMGDHYSEVSGEKLPKKFSTIFFDHLLERSKYPELEFEEENIILCTGDEHTKKSNGFPLPKHQELINKAKERFGIE